MSGHGKWQITRHRKLIGDVGDVGDAKYARLYAEAEAELWLGQLVYDRRVALGLSQTELAERAGMTQPQVSRLETGGGNIAVASLRRLAAALDADLTSGPDHRLRTPPGGVAGKLSVAM